MTRAPWGAFGFLGAYTLICVAAPLYLKKIGELGAKEMVLCVAALALLAHSRGGKRLSLCRRPRSMCSPISSGTYLLAGLFRAFAYKIRDPKSLAKIREELADNAHAGRTGVQVKL